MNELKNIVLEDARKDRIQKQIKKLKKIYCNNVDESKKNVIIQLIENVAFCYVTLEDVKDDIIKNGTSATFTQGSQFYIKENPSVGTYVRLAKTYQALLKQLGEIAEVKENIKENPIVEFAKLLGK